MLTFHPLSLADKPRIDALVREEDSRSADYNFGNMFLWDDRYHQLVAEVEHRLVVCSHLHGIPMFAFPIGSGPLVPVVEAMRGYAAAEGFPLRIGGVELRHRQMLEAAFPGCFTFRADRDHADYLYDAQALATLAGKKLHGKRNHIHRFTGNHSWRFLPLTPELFPACMALLDRWAQSAENADGSLEAEHTAITRAFAHYEDLALLGGALLAEERLVGFAIGERINSDTLDVHFEKADADVDGAYPMINREFVRLALSRFPALTYVNREDDMGLENLRKSKESYHPAFLLEKYIASWVVTP